MEEINACFDRPDERNIQYWEVIWAIWDLPKEFYIDDWVIQDQDEDWYPYGCVFFSDSQGSNIMNFLEGSDIRSSGKWMCEKAIELGKLDIKAGAYIVDWPKVWTIMGYLNWYAIIDTLELIKHSISNNRPVQCGSNKIGWSLATKENNWTVWPKDSYWHSIILNGYSDITKQFRIKQSYKKWDNWHQYLNYSDIWLLFPSKFSLIDKQDPIIINYKKKIMEWINIEKAKEAFEKWLWNGLDATKPATREEVATMILRWLEKLKDWLI